ncbi:hypothetical protein FWH09_01440 [Candidatus Saccharibacteria bacterium]|nr:hypothetical protein [Candidatus Saccharibacteria bacterium]
MKPRHKYNMYYFKKLIGQALEICFLDDPDGECMIGILHDFLPEEDEHGRDIVVMFTGGELVRFPVVDIDWIKLAR